MFMGKGPLIFVAVSQGPEFERQLTQQLMYAYNQILSVLTYTQLHNVFERRPNFDLRFLLQGEQHICECNYSTAIYTFYSKQTLFPKP